MKKPCAPGVTIHDRPSQAPRQSEPEETISEEAPFGADAPQQTVLEDPTFFAVSSMTPPRPRPRIARPPPKPRPGSLRLSPVERNRVVAVTGVALGLAAVVLWAAPSRTSLPAAVKVPPKPGVMKPTFAEASRLTMVDAPRAAAGAHEEPLLVEVALDGGGTERRPGGVLTLASNPPTDVSLVNGGTFGRTPTQVIAPVGKQLLLLENRELGVRRVVTIQMRPGRNGTQTLEFGRGWLEIHAPPNSRVSIDGRLIGTAPVAQQALFEGVHTVDVALADHTRDSRRVEVVPGLTVTHEVAEALPPQ